MHKVMVFPFSYVFMFQARGEEEDYSTLGGQNEVEGGVWDDNEVTKILQINIFYRTRKQNTMQYTVYIVVFVCFCFTFWFCKN